MSVADAIAQWLEEKGITHAFGIIGGGNVAIWDAIARRGYTALISTHHEQAAAMAAAYYYRIAGRPALALVTTGAGSANAITGVMAAHMDGIPLLVISGNEASKYMNAATRIWGVQGYDSTGVAATFTKMAKRLLTPARIRGSLNWGLDFALAPKQGAVWLDIPKDIQNAAL